MSRSGVMSELDSLVRHLMLGFCVCSGARIRGGWLVTFRDVYQTPNRGLWQQFFIHIRVICRFFYFIAILHCISHAFSINAINELQSFPDEAEGENVSRTVYHALWVVFELQAAVISKYQLTWQCMDLYLAADILQVYSSLYLQYFQEFTHLSIFWITSQKTSSVNLQYEFGKIIRLYASPLDFFSPLILTSPAVRLSRGHLLPGKDALVQSG